MKQVHDNSVICAPATSGGGALAIIRISGPGTLEIVSKLFVPADNQLDILNAKGYKIIYGTISSQGEFIDEVLLSLFRAPHSYTGEDMAEISCHASPFVQRKIMEVLMAEGAEAATPGEFTMRAFMNGKMDLSQAEAVADMIAADSEAAHRLAAAQLRGGLSHEIEKLRQELISFASLIELELDFSEEDVMFADRFMMQEKVIAIKEMVDSLASSFRLGNAFKNGIPVVIAGRPNVGKSSLLNLLLREERAIVSDIPGTTRDTIEETFHVEGLLFRFIDTAGLRHDGDQIEEMGMERTRLRVKESDIILAVAGATDNPGEIAAFINSLEEIRGERSSVIIPVINKSDLVSEDQLFTLQGELRKLISSVPVTISALLGSGLDELYRELLSAVETDSLDNPQHIVTNARHYESLKNVSENLQRVLDGFRDGIPTVLVATDVRHAIYHLGIITGRVTPDDILGEIFSRFCIGK